MQHTQVADGVGRALLDLVSSPCSALSVNRTTREVVVGGAPEVLLDLRPIPVGLPRERLPIEQRTRRRSSSRRSGRSAAVPAAAAANSGPSRRAVGGRSASPSGLRNWSHTGSRGSAPGAGGRSAPRGTRGCRPRRVARLELRRPVGVARAEDRDVVHRALQDAASRAGRRPGGDDQLGVPGSRSRGLARRRATGTSPPCSGPANASSTPPGALAGRRERPRCRASRSVMTPRLPRTMLHEVALEQRRRVVTEVAGLRPEVLEVRRVGHRLDVGRDTGKAASPSCGGRTTSGGKPIRVTSSRASRLPRPVPRPCRRCRPARRLDDPSSGVAKDSHRVHADGEHVRDRHRRTDDVRDDAIPDPAVFSAPRSCGYPPPEPPYAYP